MLAVLSHYLDSIRANLRLDLSKEREVIAELETHVEDRLQEFMDSGMSEEEAGESCLGLLGSARLVARRLYEAHSQGSWRQTLLAASPHLLFALLFVLNWWQGAGWLLVTLVPVLGAVIYGWCHGKPAWLFSWLGYSLLPVIVAGLFLLYLPAGWSWLAVLVYVPLAFWLLVSVILQTIRRDWLFASLMLLPVPLILGWLLAVEPAVSFSGYDVDRLYAFAPSIGLSFLVLALAVAIFVRLRQRWLKVSVLLAAGMSTLIMVAAYAGGKISLVIFLLLVLMLLGFFLAPAFLERRVKRF